MNQDGLIDKQKILKQYWGYESFRALQEENINQVLQKKSVLALLPTGGGKLLCYQFPALIMSGVCLVISPLFGLMKELLENCVIEMKHNKLSLV